MSKKAWITMLGKDEPAARALHTKIAEYGVSVEGHFWRDDLEKMEWSGAISDLSHKDTGLWIICGTAEEFKTKSILQGLSLLSLAVQAEKGGRIAMIILVTQGDVAGVALPNPLDYADVLTPDNPALGAKVTAKVHMPLKPLNADYRIQVFALPKVGLWLEAGPAKDAWDGALFGVASEGEGMGINAMGIGTKGDIPEKCVLEYPIRDMKIELAGQAFTAWSVQNRVSDNDSVFVRIQTSPEAILFGAFDQSEAPEVYVIRLC